MPPPLESTVDELNFLLEINKFTFGFSSDEDFKAFIDNNFEDGPRFTVVYEIENKTKIFNDCIIIGITENYTFIFSQSEKISYILPNEKVVLISIKAK